MTRKELFGICFFVAAAAAINYILPYFLPEGVQYAFLTSLVAARLGMSDSIGIRKPPPTPGAPKALPLSPISTMPTPVVQPVSRIASFVAPQVVPSVAPAVVSTPPTGSTAPLTTQQQVQPVTPAVVAAPNYYAGQAGTTQTYVAPESNRVLTFLERLYGAQRTPQSVNPFVGSAQQARQNWLNRIFVG